MAAVNWVTVTTHKVNQRIDNFLISHLKGVPKSRIYRMLRKGEVRVNKKRVKADYKLRLDDVVRIPPVQTSATSNPAILPRAVSEKLQQQIIYEDDDYIVLNKAAGVAVHGGSQLAYGLIEVLRNSLQHLEFIELVHRLDRATSGCLVLAKSRIALVNLQQNWHQENVVKEYWVLVHGVWPNDLTRVELGLQKGHSVAGERVVRVTDDGKRAVSEFQIIQRLPQHTLLSVRLGTGRMHQIRVQCTHLGYPIVGDNKYGDSQRDKALNCKLRLCLHAQRVSFISPLSGKTIVAQAPLPEPMQQLLEFVNNLSQIN